MLLKSKKKINSLNEELNKKESEVIKYNNEIALKEAEYNKKIDELKNELAKSNREDATKQVDLYGKYGSKIVEKAKTMRYTTL